MSYSPNFRGSAANASSRQFQSSFTNSSTAIGAGKPVSIGSNGLLQPLNVSIEANVLGIVGIAPSAIAPHALGMVVNGGRLENISSQFAIGAAIYVDLNGNLTNIQPSIGVNGFASGDFVVFVGVVVANQFTAGQTDIQLLLSVIGQL